MKKVFTLALLLLVVAAIAGWLKREEIKGRFWPGKVVNPLSGQPTVYDLINLLERNNLSVVGVPIIKNGTIQASISGMIVMFATDKDLFAQVRSLQLLLPKLKMDDRIIKEIDLRFNKVVLKY